MFDVVKPALFFLMVVLMGADARAQLKAEPPSLDLGRYAQDQIATAEVKLTNVGTGRIEIVGVSADCSCTAATPEKTALVPSESTMLKISVQTRAYQGMLHRNVHVQTSMGEILIPIQLKVSLYKSWELSPAVVVFPPSPQGREAKLQISLRNTGNDKASLGKITCTPTWLEAAASSEDGKVFAITLVKNADAPAGNHSAQVVVETLDPAEPRLTLNVFVPVTSDMRVTPNPVVLPTVKVGQPATREVVVHGWIGESEPRLELALGQVQKIGRDDTLLRFEVSVTPIKPGPLTQLLRIYDGEKLEVEIPVLLRAEPADVDK